MRFPNAVTILRSSTQDAYGNPARDWTAPTEIPAVGMLMGTALFLPPSADVLPGDRVRIGALLYTVDSLAAPGAGKPVLLVASLTRLPDGA